MINSIKKFRLNTVDIIISIVFIIFTLTFVIFYNYRQNTISQVVNNNSVIEVEILTQVIDNRFAENLKVGDKLLSSEDRGVIGTIKEITENGTKWIEISENNKISYNKGKILKITYIGNAIYNGNHYLSNDEKMIIGETYNYIAPSLEFSAECISINTIENSNDNDGLNTK